LWGRKFDIRVWVLVLDNYDIFMYQQGYLRTSSEAFSLVLKPSKGASADAKMVHLTNYCMQKHSKNLGKFEEGNTLSYADLQDYIDEFFPDAEVSFRNDILPRIKELILDSLLSGVQC
jgi:tubulin--tyrosine ligase